MKNSLNLPSDKDISKTLRLDDNKLPSFPQVAAKLVEASRDETVSLYDVSKILETDPGISARVLEIVNSAYYGLEKKILKVSEAVRFLGLVRIKKIALGIAVFETMFKSGKSGKFNRLLFWRHCLAVAFLSRELAIAASYPDPEEAYISGLLHDVGKIFLDIRGRVDYGEFIGRISTSTELFIEKERSELGIGHDDIGAYFCSLWKLPAKLIMAVKYHHKPFDHLEISGQDKLLISIVSMSNFICWTQGMGSFEFIRPPVLPPEVQSIINPGKIDLIPCIIQMNREVEKVSKFYGFAFPTANQLRENMLWANLRLSLANTRYYYEAPPFGQVREITAKNTLDIAKPLAKAKSIKEVLDTVMYQVGDIFQPLHWSILLKDPKTGEMVFSVVVGANKEKLKGLRIPRGEGIAGHIMATGESLIIEDVSKDKRFSSKIDRHINFKTRSIIGTPLKTDDKCFGVIELINRIDENSFSSDDLALLSSIAEYAAIAVERYYYTQALANMVTRDPLTGLKNRWSFEKAVSNRDAVLKQYGSIFSMLLIKTGSGLNGREEDEPGFIDETVKNMAGILKKTKRSRDNLFRFGEDAFILLLPLTFDEDAQNVALRIEEEIKIKIPEIGFSAKRDISSCTVNAKDSGRLKKIAAELISGTPRTQDKDDSIGKIEDSIQPLFEREAKENKAEKVRFEGKSVSLKGSFIRLKTGESGHIRVEKVSMESVGFRVSKSNRIRVNGFLDIQFFLDDVNRSLIRRRSIVREIEGNYFKADFYNPPPFAKDLGFYVLS